MKNKNKITTIFTDIGGVLLTDGWNGQWRRDAANTFNLNYGELEERHHLSYDMYEKGMMSLDDYLRNIVFYQKHSFTADIFKEFMLAQSKPFPEMIELMQHLKKTHHLKVAVISNEGRELTEYRIQKFKLKRVVDFFISSCFVHLRKPDVAIFKMAIDIAQVPTNQILYIDDRPMFVEVAQELGIMSIRHTDYHSTVEKLKEFGLT